MRELSQDEKDLLVKNGVSEEELAKQWDLFPDQDIVTVIGSIIMLKNGQGQERNEGFTSSEESKT